MATRQYIGARYVTKIYENSLDPSSAEWEPGVTYDPLTLVTYNNSSYLSKKEVPGSIGDPAANPYYWVVTGAYNGQIMTLQAQVAKLEAPAYIMETTGDSTDRSSELSTALLTHSKILFTPGDFYFATPVTLPDGAQLSGAGNSTKLIMDSLSTGYMFTVGEGNIIDNLVIDGGLSAKPANANANRHGFLVTGISDPLKLSNCNLIGFGGNAIHVDDNGYVELTSVEIVNCFFRFNGRGIYCSEHGEYALIDNSVFVDNFVGAQLNGGNNVCSNDIFARNSYGAVVDGNGVDNVGHGGFNGCTFNHNTINGLTVQNNNLGYNISSCFLTNNDGQDLVVDNSSNGVTITSCFFGIAGKISASNNGNILAVNNNFIAYPTINTDGTSKILGHGNTVASGTPVHLMNNGIDPFGTSVLTKTYSNNVFVTEANFNSGIIPIYKGGFVYVAFNLNISTTPGGALVTIGKINLPSALPWDSNNDIVAYNGGHYLLKIDTAGNVSFATSDNSIDPIRCDVVLVLS